MMTIETFQNTSLGSAAAAVIEKLQRQTGYEIREPVMADTHAVQRIEPQQMPAAITPIDMLNRAVSQGADITILEKLMGLQERWEANQAKKAFDAAVAEAKAHIPPIVRNATGHNNKKYADFSAIAKVIDPILGERGLSYRFRSHQAEKISVTCVLSHRDGHAEETTLTGPADTSGNKNAIQAIGSTLTYLQRYSLIQMLGLAAAEDDDGQKSKKEDVELDESVETYLGQVQDRIASFGSADALKSWWREETKLRADLGLVNGKPGYARLFEMFAARGKELSMQKETA